MPILDTYYRCYCYYSAKLADDSVKISTESYICNLFDNQSPDIKFFDSSQDEDINVVESTKVDSVKADSFFGDNVPSVNIINGMWALPCVSPTRSITVQIVLVIPVIQENYGVNRNSVINNRLKNASTLNNKSKQCNHDFVIYVNDLDNHIGYYLKRLIGILIPYGVRHNENAIPFIDRVLLCLEKMLPSIDISRLLQVSSTITTFNIMDEVIDGLRTEISDDEIVSELDILRVEVEHCRNAFIKENTK